MAGGGGGGNTWIGALIGGGILCGVAYGLEHAHTGPGWLIAALLAVGGIAVVFGSCEAMIKSVEGLGERLGWNQFVAGTMAGLASNLPEVVMLAFVIAKEPRVAFVVVALTLHVGALSFGVYAGLLPRDEHGSARMPEPMVKLSTDLYACAGGVLLAVSSMMITMRMFHKGEGPAALNAWDLYVIGAVLLFVEAVALVRLVKRFSASDAPKPAAVAAAASAAAPASSAERAGEAEADAAEEDAEAKTGADADAEATEGEAKAETPAPAPAAADSSEAPSWGVIAFFGVLGIVTSVIGGHAVGEFADILVKSLTARGYSEMVGAIVISVFACSGAYLMIATAHFKGMYDLALANVSGQVTQVPFVVLPISLIMIGAFGQLGMVPTYPDGVLPIDLETTSVMVFGFPTMLILWKSIQDDGRVNWLETASMVGLFALTIYLLAAHG